MVVITLRLLRNRFHVLTRHVFEKVLVGFELERHVFGEERVGAILCDLYREHAHVFVSIKIQRIGHVVCDQRFTRHFRVRSIGLEQVFCGLFDSFEVAGGQNHHLHCRVCVVPADFGKRPLVGPRLEVKKTPPFKGVRPMCMLMTVAVVMIAVEGNRFDPRRRHDAGTVKIRRLDQPVEPALELQAVDHQHIGLAHGAGGLRGGLVDMRIPVGAHQRGDVHMIAPDTFDHVAEDRECRHDGIGSFDCAMAGPVIDRATSAVADWRSVLRVVMGFPFRLQDDGAGGPARRGCPPARRPATARRRDPPRG